MTSTSQRLRTLVYCSLGIAALCALACGPKPPSSGTVGPKSFAESNPPLVIRPADPPSGTDSREPELSVTKDGRLILSWVEKSTEGSYALRFAVRDTSVWSTAATVAEGNDWFVNWADFPSVIGLSDGSMAAHWLVKSGAGSYAYNVNIARSQDGRTWSKPVVPHNDQTQTEHGFVSLLPLPDGRIGAVWVDGRNLKDVNESHDEGAPLPVSMTLRYAAIDAAGGISDEVELDERICECCQTSAALTSEGAIAVYRDRSTSEVRDIYAVSKQQGNWSKPRQLYADSWDINGCPVNGPSIAAEDRRVAVAWYTEAQQSPRVKIVFSTDAGATFSTPIEVDDGQAIGRADVALLADGSALVCWMSGTTEGGAIKVRRVTPDGSLGPVSIVAETSISRSSGFPRIARQGDEIHFAWTEFGKPSRVRIATADVSPYK